MQPRLRPSRGPVGGQSSLGTEGSSFPSENPPTGSGKKMCNYCNCGFPEFAEHDVTSQPEPDLLPTPEDLATQWQNLLASEGMAETSLTGKARSTTISAGRKAGSRALQIPDGTQCEWAGLKNAGGGVVTIVGCRVVEEKLATHKHHGPDKSTLNNDRSNVHLICVRCHNRWHQLNDEFYGVRPPDNGPFVPKNGILIPHDPVTLADEADFQRTEEFWSTRRLFKAKKE